jgi:hypothetical protein
MAAITLGFAMGAGIAKEGGGHEEGGGGHDGVAPGQWVIMTYVPDNGYTVPVPLHVTAMKGGGVSFDFLPTPDRAMLLTDVKGHQETGGHSDRDDNKPAKTPADNLTGKTILAHIAIKATPGAKFNYCGPNCDGTDPGGFVRLYLQGTNPALTGCQPGWHPERPDCEAQYWWSNPIAIDLDALAALGTVGTVLQVPLNVSNWSDRDGHFASALAPIDHPAAFAAAVANATKVGLSFGGGNNFAFGAGVTAPAEATFQLLEFDID